MYAILGQYQKAEELCLNSLELRKKILGVKHPDYASSLNRLALIYKETWQYEKAEPLFEEALEIRKKVLGEDHPDFASSLYNLALLNRINGKLLKADSMIQRVIAIRKKLLGINHPDYAAAISGLGFTRSLRGLHQEAEQLYLQALEIRKNSLGVKSPDYSSTLFDLAKLYSITGQHDKSGAFAMLNCTAYLEKVGRSFAIFSESEKRAYLENNSDILRVNHSFLFNHRDHSHAYYLNIYVVKNQGCIYRNHPWFFLIRPVFQAIKGYSEGQKKKAAPHQPHYFFSGTVTFSFP
jgi:tetratricopeptide (TPR) repeat protein